MALHAARPHLLSSRSYVPGPTQWVCLLFRVERLPRETRHDSHALIFACYFRSIMSLLWEAQAESQRLPRIHPEELSNALAHSTVDKGEEERRLPGFATRPSRSGDVNVCSAPGEGRLFSQ